MGGLKGCGLLLALHTATQLAPLAAQAPEESRSLRAFRDSILAMRDTTLIARLAEQYEQVSVSPEQEAMARIRAGHLRLAIGQPEQANADFSRAVRLQPLWPAAWTGAGDARAALGLRTWRNKANLGTHPGAGEFQKAADDYARAFALDPRFVEAVESELRLAVERRDTALLAAATGRARRLPPDAGTPLFFLALSRVEWRMGDVASALAALRSVPESAMTPAIRYERARAALALGQPLGELDYWGAVSADDPEMLLMLRRDMSLIATPSELGMFDAAAGEDRVTFLHQFWEDHAGLWLRSPGERMREHYRRIAYADRYFAFSEVRHMRKPDDLNSSFPFDSMLDSRGVVYVRMGPPDVRVEPFACGYVANETWGYHRADDELLLHFASQNSIGDFVLVQSVQDINHEAAPQQLTAVHYSTDPATDSLDVMGNEDAVMGEIAESRKNPYCGNELWEMLAQRQSVSPTYAKLLSAGRNSGGRYLDQLALLGRRSIRTSTTTDAQPLRFPVSVTSQVLPLAIGAAAGGSGLQIAVALVQPRHGGPDRRDTLRLRFGAFDAMGRAVTQFDSTLAYAPPPRRTDGDSSYTAFGHFSTALPAGTWKWTAAVQSGDSSGALLTSQLITVPLHDATRLAVSDLAIGANGQSAPWPVAAGDTAWLTPRHGYAAGTPVGLYYEVYGIPAGQSYQTEVTARHGDDGKGPGITLGFEEKSTGTPTRLARTLSLKTLEPGDYIIEVRVTNAGGQTAASSRPLRIVRE
jgi:tetratricopeptide (TPR) repeat protein